MAPTADYAAADGQHVDRSHRRGSRQSHQECGRKHVDVGDEHHVAADRLRYHLERPANIFGSRRSFVLRRNGKGEVGKTFLEAHMV